MLGKIPRHLTARITGDRFLWFCIRSRLFRSWLGSFRCYCFARATFSPEGGSNAWEEEGWPTWTASASTIEGWEALGLTRACTRRRANETPTRAAGDAQRWADRLGTTRQCGWRRLRFVSVLVHRYLHCAWRTHRWALRAMTNVIPDDRRRFRNQREGSEVESPTWIRVCLLGWHVPGDCAGIDSAST